MFALHVVWILNHGRSQGSNGRLKIVQLIPARPRLSCTPGQLWMQRKRFSIGRARFLIFLHPRSVKPGWPKPQNFASSLHGLHATRRGLLHSLPVESLRDVRIICLCQ